MKRLIHFLLLLLPLTLLTNNPAIAGNNAEPLEWDQLIPPGQSVENLVEEYRQKYNIDELPDGDPILVELMKKLQTLQKNAPLNEALDGRLVKLAGYVVPLETDGQKSTEFILVPYFGACIHVPPPPANQTVYVTVKNKEGAAIRKLYDVVWVTGRITTQRFNADIADAGYTLEAVAVEPYL